MYILDDSTIINHASLANQDFHNKIKLWHLRLSHVSERGLVELAKKGLIGSKKLHKLEFCDYCILGIQHMVMFMSGLHNSSKLFKHINSDL